MVSGEPSDHVPIERTTNGLQRPGGPAWLLVGLFGAVLLCGAIIPITALLRGTLRFGAVTVAADRQVGAPLVVLRGPVTIDGVSRAPVVVIGGRATLRGVAGDDLIVLGGDVLLSQTAVARGNVVAFGGRVFQSGGATISGSMIGNRTPWSLANLTPHTTPLAYLIARLRLAGLVITALLLLGLAVWAVLPWPALVTTATARRFRVRSALIGLIALLWTPLIVAPLAVSLAGLPVAVLLVLGLGCLWLVGIVSSAVRLGHRLLSLRGHKHSVLSATLTGLICLGLLPALPVIGSLVLLIAGCVGLGAALMAVWDREATSSLAVMQTLSTLMMND